MWHAESLSGSLALLLWCSSDENRELTHIEKKIGRVHSALNSKRTGAAQEKDKCRMNINRCKFTLMTGSYQCQFQIVGHLGPHFVSGKLETTSWSAYDD
jgi:hypothetical protein